MKKVVYLTMLLVIATSCKKEEKVKVIRDGKVVEISASEIQQSNNDDKIPPADGKYPEMTFEETEYDFGAINQGDKVSGTFTFKNTGEADLLIKSAVGSCGCTVPNYPKENIKPGDSGQIKVTFDSSGKTGNQNKSVTLTTNTEAGIEKLQIKASINPVSGTNMQPVATPNK